MVLDTLADNPRSLVVPDLIPARMLNEFAYCPRLCYLEWVQQEWDDNEWTLDGTYTHRRVDRPGGALPDPDEAQEVERIHARSVMLSAPRAGLIARMDLIEGAGGRVSPVDYKRGPEPNNDERSWEPERVQLAAQAIVLRENGYACESGVLYYAQSKRRVEIRIDETLTRRALDLAQQMRAMGESGVIPLPLVDSPKCPKCSLVGICLPDETRFAAHPIADPAPVDQVRRLYPARDDAIPLYVQDQGAYVGKSGEVLTVKKNGAKISEAKLMELSQLCLYGSVQISTQAIQELLKRSIPVLYFSYGGWFHGLCGGMTHKNIELRRKQFQLAETPIRVDIARSLVLNKIQNCRTLLRRNSRDDVNDALNELRSIEIQTERAQSLETLLGYEGNAARVYFQRFASMIKPPDAGASLGDFDFQTRNRRPPRDPVNALLSLAYSLLTKDITITLLSVGFDPYLGYYHQPRYGRPALALDLMEPFRPLIGDSTVLTAINNGVTQSGDFIRAGGAVSLKPDARKRFILAYERRMDTLVTHPLFNYRLSYRRLLELHSRLFGRYLLGELSEPPTFVTR